MRARDESTTRPVYTDPLPRLGHCGPGHCRGLTCCSYECAQGRCPSAIAAGIIPAPEPGTTRYLCPLGCGWSFGEPVHEPPSLAGLSLSASADVLTGSTWWQEAQQIEQELREHLATHANEETQR